MVEHGGPGGDGGTQRDLPTVGPHPLRGLADARRIALAGGVTQGRSGSRGCAHQAQAQRRGRGAHACRWVLGHTHGGTSTPHGSGQWSCEDGEELLAPPTFSAAARLCSCRVGPERAIHRPHRDGVAPSPGNESAVVCFIAGGDRRACKRKRATRGQPHVQPTHVYLRGPLRNRHAMLKTQASIRPLYGFRRAPRPGTPLRVTARNNLLRYLGTVAALRETVGQPGFHPAPPPQMHACSAHIAVDCGP